MAEYFDDIRQKETPVVVSRYERIYRGLPIDEPEGREDAEGGEGVAAPRVPPPASQSDPANILFYEPDDSSELDNPDQMVELSVSISDSGGHPLAGSTETGIVHPPAT